MSASPTQRSLKHMRDQGYMSAVVERWNPHAKIRQDLFGIIDVVCIGKDIVGVQSTSYKNVSSRLKKITDSPALPVLRNAGIRVLVHGWHKVGNRWQVREVDVS